MTPPSPNQTVINTLLANGWLRRPEEENLLYKVSDGSELSYLHDIAPTLTEPVAGNLLIYDETIGKFHEYSDTSPNPAPAGGEDESKRPPINEVARVINELFLSGEGEGYDKEWFRKQLIERITPVVAQSNHQAVQKALTSELESLREQTRETTIPEAYVTDTGVAQSIRVHTNALIEHRLAALAAAQPRKDGDE